MTPDEQRMIQDLFQRLSAQGRISKDPQADRVISDSVRSNPDALYMLVQTALVYEHQMEEQELRVRDLEEQIAGLQRGSQSSPSGSSFLGGRIGAGRGSVPNTAASPSPWQSAPQPSAYNQQPQRQAPPSQYAQQPSMAPQAAAPGGGFFKSALQTAAGVAGGMMVANSLSSMFGGGHNAAQAATHNDNSGALTDADQTQDELQDAAYEAEPAASSDSSGWDDVET